MMNHLLNIIKTNFKGKINIYPRREGLFQLLLPIYYEDGDMIDIYLTTCPDNNEKIRILDCGMTLMKLSYTYDINSPSKEKIFNKIINQNRIINQDGNLYLDTSSEFVYQNIMQFAGCQQRVLDMRLWNIDNMQSIFYVKLDEFIETKLKRFKPKKSVIPLKNFPVIEVDYSFEFSNKQFYLFGVNNKEKAKNSAIALIEFQKANLTFISMIVHENILEIPDDDQIYLTQNADKQFPTLEIFEKMGASTIERLSS